jgi:D-alanyl-D-alanine carboxypeptidase
MKKIIYIFLLLFPLALFSQQQSIKEGEIKGNNIDFQVFGNGKNNLVFLFSDIFDNKVNQENFVKHLKTEADKLNQNKIFAFFLSSQDSKECWLRNFSENHQQSLFYYTKQIDCGKSPETSNLTKELVAFFKENKTFLQSEKTIVFLIRNDIKSIYLANYSSKVQNCISLLKKEGIVTDIYPQVHVGGTLSLWLEKQYEIPLITIPFDLFKRLGTNYFVQIFKNDLFRDLFKKDENEKDFFKKLILQTLPTECKIANNEEAFFELLEKCFIIPELLLLPNKQHSLDKDYIPFDLQSLDGRNLSPKRGIKIRKEALNALVEMKKAAESEKCNLQVISAFRSYNTQQNVFMHWVKEFGIAEAQRISARPGTSQHQLGTAIDFNLLDESFENYPEGKWLADNAYKYGFILSFPKGMEHFTGYRYEPWHYRYVGKEAALLIKNYFNNNLELFLQWYWRMYQPLS